MTALFVCSTEARAGKTMLAVGLAKQFTKNGLSVGYMKAVTVLNEGESLEGSDAGFAKAALGLAEPLELLAPVQITTGELRSTGTSGDVSALDRISAAYKEVSSGKDVVIVEGGSNLAEGSVLGVSGPEVVAGLSARAVLLAGYRSDGLVSAISNAAQYLGPALLGVVVNSVPSAQERFCASAVSCLRGQNGAAVIGVLPQVRSLMAVSVRDMVGAVGGSVLCCPEGLDRSVESIMIGTINHEDALAYFERKANKVVVASGGRPDMQLAALASATSCLVLAGKTDADPYVLSRGREVGVPIIRTDIDTTSALGCLQTLFDSARFRHKAKIEAAERLLADHLDLEAVLAGLGLPKRAA